MEVGEMLHFPLQQNARIALHPMPPPAHKGRGAVSNPTGRFEKFYIQPDPESDLQEDETGPRTEFFTDHTESIFAKNQSPDVPFDLSINPYRGCEHGCAYCFARPSHEYLGFSAGLDFESKIMVKPNAAKLLREEFSSPKWKPQVVAMSGVTDCYQPIERKLKITRSCLEVFVEARNPIAMITKNFLITRDIDLLKELTRFEAVAVFISITTLDPKLASRLEPRASLPAKRLEAIRVLKEAGIPTGIMMAPVIPGLTDHEIFPLLDAAAKAGASSAGYVLLRLPYGVKDVFEQWLEAHYPLRKEAVLSRIRATRDGKLYESEFSERMKGSGLIAEQIHQQFEIATRRSGLSGARRTPELSIAHFRRPSEPQLELF
jgi:DNA repair photolyase